MRRKGRGKQPPLDECYLFTTNVLHSDFDVKQLSPILRADISEELRSLFRLVTHSYGLVVEAFSIVKRVTTGFMMESEN